jgi:signal peptidase II
VLLLDLWTKQLVFSGQFGIDPGSVTSLKEFIPPARYPAPGLGGHVRLVALFNPGMMWGAFQNYPKLLLVVRPLAVLVIFALLSSLPAGQWSSRLALGGILGGALGNIHDSFRYVGVRDFLEVNFDGVPLCHPFPAFNLADSAICVGVAVLALGMMRGSRHEVAGAPVAS